MWSRDCDWIRLPAAVYGCIIDHGAATQMFTLDYICTHFLECVCQCALELDRVYEVMIYEQAPQLV